MSTPSVNSIVILGGGTAGWMAASSLAKYFTSLKIPMDIQLVESTDIGTVGVGEATLPGIRDFNASLGIDEVDFIRKTQATFKLGIEFKDWNHLGESFFHPFANFGFDINNVSFHHYIRKLNELGDNLNLEDYSLPTALSKLGNFAQPHAQPSTPLGEYHYAFHFDATLYAKYLRNFALNHGVKRYDNKVTSVNTRVEDGFIKSLTLDSGATIEGDLFIDCSGFRGLLIEETLHTGYEDWSHWLNCNSAIALQSEHEGAPPPFTSTQALAAGWQWKIPLQNRMGNGYVYCDKYISDDEAINTLTKNIKNNLVADPKIIKFTAGHRLKCWNKNCVALGLAVGFLEPLESTSISMIQTGIARLLKFFPHKGFDSHDTEEVNRLCKTEFERIRDFLILHYSNSARLDTPFWRDCNNRSIPNTLAHKISIFKSRGHLIHHEGESFQDASWLTMYNGFKIDASQWDARANYIEINELRHNLEQMKKSIQHAAKQAITHEEFIARHCRSQE
ncbi:tryptophan halogenase family protein [Teredinibacter haidensis]|uniref:tryptophan halogenase family protein n=1 Tax=Teredinibacter haidensis TaxID=2731755 RepID=UPI000948BF06|nr:tryptophan halogenase family protein [Teredinibacter haidensis]